jgi:molybdate transport system ATP-binding protein
MIQVRLKKKLHSSEGAFELDINLTIPLQSFTILCGDSGAGKTSILRMISGLMLPDSGQITYEGQVWYDSKKDINLSPKDRGLGFVFQEHSLFPNMTVRQHLEYALGKNNNGAEIDLLIHQFQLDGLQNRKPATLSGGQKQKVSLARSIIKRPKLLLLDEPLSALDHNRRTRFQDFILKTHEDYKLTTIMVSHDAAEINKMAQVIFMVENGQIKTTSPSLLPTAHPGNLATIISTAVEHESIKLEVSLDQNSSSEPLKKLAAGDRIWLTETSLE